jgi:hypothetical protein
MNAAPGNIPAPMQGSSPDVLEIDETLSSEESFPNETDMALYGGLVFWMVWACRVWKKPTERGIFQECPVELWDIAIGLIKAGLHTVDDDAYRTSPKELQCFFECSDYSFEILPKYRHDAGKPAIAKHHDEGVNQSRLAAAQILQVAQSTKIDLGELSRLPIKLSDCKGAPLPKIAPLASKAV